MSKDITNTLQDKIIAAFKGFITTYKLLSVKEKQLFEDPNYIRSWKHFSSETELFELFYKKQLYDWLIDLVDRLFHNQTDRKFVSRCLMEVVTEWIEKGYSTDDQTQLEQSAANFLKKVESAIKSYIVYVPLEGIKFESRENLELARCQLYRNYPESELIKAIRQDRERLSRASEKFDENYSSVEEVSAFFKVNLSGHSGRIIQKSKEEANLALNVLRLFIGSYYIDIYRRKSTPKYMGIVGTLPVVGQHSNIFFAQTDIPLDTQYPGHSVQIKHRDSFELDWRDVEGLNSSLLSRINYLLCSLATDKRIDTARRLLRAINWFGKASTTNSIAESFLLYSIAVESLLSEGRTPKETYAKRVAALITCCDDEIIYPGGGYLSSEFGKKLKDASSKNDRFALINERTIELFNYRNDIAHGMVLEDEIEAANLLDLETLIRNSILSFVKGGWDTLGQFKTWMKQNVS